MKLKRRLIKTPQKQLPLWRRFLAHVVWRIFFSVSHDVFLFILMNNSLSVNPAKQETENVGIGISILDMYSNRRPFSSCFEPHYESEASCVHSFYSETLVFFYMQTKLIFA